MADWSNDEIQKVWEKADIVPNNDPNVFRKDQCGAWIRRDLYGAPSKDESHTSFKWQIDHIKPQSKEGKDILSNARPLQWFNNDSRQNSRFKTKITSDGTHNIEIDK